MFTEALRALAAALLDSCREKGLKITTVESCTGGLVSALLTDIPGSSDIFERGYVTYSNEAKTDALGVDKTLLEKHGAVSEPVALAMAEGALADAHADIAVSITGIAGPGGGSEAKPVGLVFIAVATKNSVQCEKNIFSGNRSEIRVQAVEKALAMIGEAVG